jgi:hypothetical protein
MNKQKMKVHKGTARMPNLGVRSFLFILLFLWPGSSSDDKDVAEASESLF